MKIRARVRWLKRKIRNIRAYIQWFTTGQDVLVNGKHMYNYTLLTVNKTRGKQGITPRYRAGALNMAWTRAEREAYVRDNLVSGHFQQHVSACQWVTTKLRTLRSSTLPSWLILFGLYDMYLQFWSWHESMARTEKFTFWGIVGGFLTAFATRLMS